MELTQQQREIIEQLGVLAEQLRATGITEDRDFVLNATEVDN